MDKKEMYKKKMEAQVNELIAKIDLLSAKADKTKASAEINISKSIDDIRLKKKAVDKKLEELMSTGNESWEKVKEETESSYNQLKENANDILKKIGV